MIRLAIPNTAAVPVYLLLLILEKKIWKARGTGQKKKKKPWLLSRNKIIHFHAQSSTKELKRKKRKEICRDNIDDMQWIPRPDLTNDRLQRKG